MKFSLLIIIRIFLCFTEEINVNLKKLNRINEISLIIRPSAKNQTFNILSSKYKGIEPYQIYINGILQNYSGKIITSISAGNHKIVMKWNTQITSCEKMFYENRIAENIDISKFDSSKVTNMAYMFWKSNLPINFNNFKTSLVTNMSYMFGYCKNESLKLNNFDTSATVDMTGMFYECESLKSLYINKFNTSSVISMSYMFYFCLLLKNLNIINFNTSSVTDMSFMFYKCQSIYSLKINISNFDTSSVTNMKYMFCASIILLDLSFLNTSSFVDMSGMFCAFLGILNFTNFNTSSVTSMERMFIYNEKESFDLSRFDTSSVINMEEMFFGYKNLKALDLSSFNTSSVTNMKRMFSQCESLTSLNLNNFHTPFVEIIDQMFSYCYELKVLYLNNFKTSYITTMNKLFYRCYKLQKLDLKSFNTSSVTDMASMFEDNNSLTSLDISNNYSTLNVFNMSHMFYNCYSLTSLNLSIFKTDNVKDMSNIFENCHNLFFIELNNFNTSSVNKMEYMFSNCGSLKSLDLSNFNTSKVTNMEGIFYKCSDLSSLNIMSFNTSKITNMRNMFANCNSLISLDLSNFNTSIVNNMGSMFYNCNSLLFINLISFKEANNLVIYNIFYNTPNDLIYCINEENFPSIKSYIVSKKNDCDNICFRKTKKIILEKRMCILDCNINDNLYYNYNKTECIETIPYGSYINDSMHKTIDKCNNKCKECSFNSTIYNLCISCNNGFFPKINDTQNKENFINCYNDLDGYFLENNIYMPCYNNCKKCLKKGDEKNNFCVECYENYTIINDFENETNCLIKCENNYYFNSEKKYFCTIDKKCPDEYNKFIKEKNRCIDNCFNDNIYKFEFNNICYKSCPKNTILSLIDNFTCIFNSGTCNAYKFFKNLCQINGNNPEEIDNIIKMIRKEMPDISVNITENKIKELSYNETIIIFTITALKNQNFSQYNFKNIDIINLNECEQILRKIYKINANETLILFKIDIFIKGLLIPIIEYEIYEPINKTKLDLNYCKNVNVNLSMTVSINENHLFKHNSSHEFYNDICYPYSTKNNTDIILRDRQNEFIKNNYSLCENNCIYKGYDYKGKKALCTCTIKTRFRLFTEIIIDPNLLLKNFIDLKKITNIAIIKCYKLLFSLEGFKYNIGNYIMLFIILINFLLFLIFIFKGYNLYLTKIKGLIKSIKERININNKNNNNNNKNNRNNNSLIIDNKERNIRFISSKINTKIININKKDYISKTPKKRSINIIKTNADILSNTGKQLKIKNDSLEKPNSLNASLLKLDISNIKELQNMKYNDYEINSLDYDKALKYDKRTYLKFYISLLKRKHLLIFTFYINNDYNSKILKISLFFFSFGLYLTINALFFTDSTMHKIYEDKGIFNFYYQIPKIVYSSLASIIITSIIQYFALSEKNVLEIKKEKENVNKKESEIIKCLKIKFCLYFIFNFLILILFWYYISCFCSVYKNTQIHLIKDTLISYGLTLIYPFVINLFPGIFRIISLKDSKRKYLYNFSKFIQII